MAGNGNWTACVRRGRHAAAIALLSAFPFGTVDGQLVELPTAPLGGDTEASSGGSSAAEPPPGRPQAMQPPPAERPRPNQSTPIQPTTDQPAADDPASDSAQTAPGGAQPLPPQPEGVPADDDSLPQPGEFQPLAAGGPSAALPTAAGTTASSFSAAPTMIGDFFGGGFSGFQGSQTVSFSGHAPGRILSGGPGQANSTLAYEFGNDTAPDDIFTSGTGTNANPGSGPDSDGVDTFNILEPVPPADVTTAPGPGFQFNGGTAVYTGNTNATTAQPGIYNDGEQWFISYSYTGAVGETDRGFIPVPGPGVSTRRVKISENFSPEVRDRCFVNYSFFNDAYGGLGDISRYLFGYEKILVEDLISIEARLPTAGTYGSTQRIDGPENRDFEVGNAALIAKGVLLRRRRFLWSGGMGVTLPLADDTKLRGGGQDLLVIENEAVHLLPFTGMLYRQSRDTSFQGYMQLDVAANGDPIYGNLFGGPLPKLGVFNDSTLLHADVAINHSIYRACCAKVLNQVILNAELHYTGTLQDSDFIESGGLTYTNLKENFNIVNATAGMHLVLGDNLVVTPAMSVPLRDGLDEQFDYEAMVQVNYLR